MKKVGIIMGSDSDLPIVKKATDQLAALEIPFEAHVYSAHRTPEEARDFSWSGYRFDPERSDEASYVFLREPERG